MEELIKKIEDRIKHLQNEKVHMKQFVRTAKLAEAQKIYDWVIEFSKLRQYDVIGSTYTPSKAMDDYEFSTHRHWLDEQKQDDDDHGGTIKHFRD